MKKLQLYRVKAEYLYGDEKDKKRADQIALLQKLGLEETEESARVICTAEQAIALIIGGYCGTYFDASSVSTIAQVDAGPDVEGLFAVLAEKIASMPQASVNERCGQQQPGNALMAVAETKLLEDSCTDVLQGHLADGWRIIAVQPQPDQRRPDYILGRPLMSALR